MPKKRTQRVFPKAANAQSLEIKSLRSSYKVLDKKLRLARWQQLQAFKTEIRELIKSEKDKGKTSRLTVESKARQSQLFNQLGLVEMHLAALFPFLPKQNQEKNSEVKMQEIPKYKKGFKKAALRERKKQL